MNGLDLVKKMNAAKTVAAKNKAFDAICAQNPAAAAAYRDAVVEAAAAGAAWAVQMKRDLGIQ